MSLLQKCYSTKLPQYKLPLKSIIISIRHNISCINPKYLIQSTFIIQNTNVFFRLFNLNNETIILNLESGGKEGCGDDVNAREKELVTVARRCNEVKKKKMERRRECARGEGKRVRGEY